MNTIQQIISDMKDEFSRAEEFCNNDKNRFSNSDYHMGGVKSALEKYIPKLESLLNEQPEAITEDSHLRKHDVGRSAADNDISTKGNDLCESSSETQAVGQNEQMQKSCNHSCSPSDWYRGGKCDKMGCYYEDELQDGQMRPLRAL